MNDQEVRQRVAQAEKLLADVEALRDPQARNTAVSAVQVLLALYGEALARMLRSSEQLCGAALQRAYVEDELVAHLLLLHDLHPADLPTRVAQALAEARPFLQSQGGDVELVGVADGVVRVRLVGTCQGCGKVAGWQTAVEQAIYAAAPDVTVLEVEDATLQTPAGFVSLDSLRL